MTKNDSLKVIDQFVEAAIKHAEATETGNYKSGNKYYKQLSKAGTFLKNANSLQDLQPLLDHPSIGVRLWSAAYLLSVCELQAKNTLKEIAAGKDIHSLTAKVTLDEWEKGNLKL